MFRIGLLIVLSFVAGFSANNCKFDVKLKYFLGNEGFHRNISYNILFSNEKFIDKCTIGLDQTLPSGVFTNPDELGDLRRVQKLAAIPKNRVNVELPAEESQPTSVFIMSKLKGGRADTWLPVHARYHHANSEGGFARNEIEPPRLYLRCPDKRLDQCEKTSSMIFLCNENSKEKCAWRPIPVTVESDTLILEVPVGNTSDYYLVTSITGCVIFAGSLYLLKTLHEYKMTSKKLL